MKLRNWTHGITITIAPDDGARSFNRKSAIGIARALECSVFGLCRAITLECVRLADPALGHHATEFEIRIRRGRNDGKVWAGKSSAWLNAT